MQAEISHFVLIAAALCAVFLSLPTLLGSKSRAPLFVHLWKPALGITFAGLSFALIMLIWAFLTNDFSIAYVANNSNTKLDPVYKISAVWGSHEGSMLLWVWTITVWASLFAVFSRDDELFKSRVLGVLLGVTGLICLFLIFTSNPFERLLPLVPPEGKDLNPILQDIGMILHPPMLFLGYAGTALCFAFGLGALMEGKVRPESLRGLTTISVIAWLFLTAGNVLGSWWAYNELGWGGWWFWDPVENASFMPWLTATALLHSLAVTEKRGCFKIWTVLLALITFSLSLLGTFLVRSGVLTSVHAFATDPQRGLFILGLLVLVIGGSLLLFAWRAPKVGTGGAFELFSREAMLLVNNVLLVVAMLAVLLGTLYPLFIDALNAGKISVGPPYFDSVFGPIMVPVIILMGIGPLVRWKDAKISDIIKRTAWCFIAAVILGAATPLIKGWSTWLFVGLTMSWWVLFTFIESLRENIRNFKGSFFSKIFKLSRSWWGMMIAHLGVAVSIVGIGMVMTYSLERDVTMTPGHEVNVGSYDFKFEDVKRGIRGPNYIADEGVFKVTENGKEVAVLTPQKRKYFSSQMPMTEAAISSSITGDVYVSMGDQTVDGAWVVRAYDKPFVTWIWWGTLIMSLGAFIAMLDTRYRTRRRARSAQAE